MTINDEWNKKDDEEGGEGESGSGGVEGKVQFRYKDAASLGPRDDMLPPHEIQRLIVIHRDLHKERVDKQKSTRKERQALKEGKIYQKNATQQALQMGQSGAGRYKQHPISNKAQFSGMDRQMTITPNDFDAETNLEMREKLENRFTHTNVPQFNPKPRPRG